jgi:hypothetical protein
MTFSALTFVVVREPTNITAAKDDFKLAI